MTDTAPPRANIERIATLYNAGKFDEAQEALDLIIEACTHSLRPQIAPCNCGMHLRGHLTGGWQCPTHGQQF
jgi:hypothetical protein